jgi:cytoskeleton protein RodZ
VSEVEAEKEGLPVGEYLKRVRESRGVQLDDASRVTKIGKSYLVAIEEGRFEKLPNPAYIKGFLRLYASFLSLSGDEVLQMYERSAPKPPPDQAEPHIEQPHVEFMERAKIGGPSRWVIPALLLVLVIAAAIFLSDNEERPARPTVPAPAPVEPRPAPAPAPVAPQAAVLPPRSSAAPSPGAQPNPAAVSAVPATVTAPPADRKSSGVVLRLHFNRDSWLSITIDDSISQRYDLKAGDIIEWKGSKSFVVDVGDGGAVEGEFNGRPLKQLGEAGKPAHVELKGQ